MCTRGSGSARRDGQGAASGRAFLGLGSNLGSRLDNLREAIGRLVALEVSVDAVSSIYESAPVGPVTDQPPFLNAVVCVDSVDDAGQLLRICQHIEEAMGRERAVCKGPRTIDLDVLLVGNTVSASAELTVPHPGLTQRAFVLLPLLELAPALRDPRDGHLLSHDLPGVLASQPIVCYSPATVLGGVVWPDQALE